MKNFFLSLKTTVWTLLVLICFFFAGAYLMPAHREVFAPMNEDILLRWAAHSAADNLQYTWWFFAVVAGLVLLSANTLACSIQAIRAKWARTDALARISPQVIHIGFLFILLGHLLGAGWGYKLSGLMPEGAYAPLPEDKALRLERIHVRTDAQGFMQDWSAEASLYEGDQMVKRGTLGPNEPLFFKGVGIYLKSLNFDKGPAAVLVIAKDPGALWALIGGMLFMTGSITLVVLKWKKV
jgi:cytochrome c biogenesis protein ResB